MIIEKIDKNVTTAYNSDQQLISTVKKEKKEEENRAFSIVNRKDGERANPNIPLWKSVHSKW